MVDLFILLSFVVEILLKWIDAFIPFWVRLSIDC